MYALRAPFRSADVRVSRWQHRFLKRTFGVQANLQYSATAVHPRVVYENLTSAFDISSRQRVGGKPAATRPQIVSAGPIVKHAAAEELSPEGLPVQRVEFACGAGGLFEIPLPGKRSQTLDKAAAQSVWPDAVSLADLTSEIRNEALDASLLPSESRCLAEANWLSTSDPSLEHLASWIEGLRRRGVALVKGMQAEAGALQALVASQFVAVRATVYGEVFTIKSVAKPNNLAYSADGLQLHTDLPFYSQPPAVQWFACVQQAEQGGESIFGDGFAAAAQLWREDQEAFEVLLSHPVLFYDLTPSWHMEATHPILQRDARGSRNADGMPRLERVCFNQRVRDSWRQWDPRDARCSDDDLDRFYAALDKYEDILERPENQLSIRLQPGECVVTDNWRVLHSRSSFVGARHFEGCYTDWDALKGVWRRSQRAKLHRN